MKGTSCILSFLPLLILWPRAGVASSICAPTRLLQITRTECYHEGQTKRQQPRQRLDTTALISIIAPATTSPLSVTQRLISGGVSRALSQAVLYPMDALRTLAQTRDGRTLADVGVQALVRGGAQTSCFALFIGSIQFAVFGVCRSSWGWNPIVSSAMGAAVSCLVSVPQDVLKQRLVTGVYPSFRKAVATIYRTEGILGFYSAWRPCMARNVPFVMTTFTTAELLKRQFRRKKHNREEDLNLIGNMVIGMSSALVAGLLTQPVDVIKTRMMTQAASTAVPYTSAMDCFVTILRTEGVLTLYSGFMQRSTYMCLLWGTTFALNDQFERLQLLKTKRQLSTQVV